MSVPVSSPTKKRKHGEVAETSAASPYKKVKKAGHEKKSKSKSKADGQFQVVNASVQVSIPPRCSLDPLSGTHEMLDSLVMRYVPALGGVMLCHSNARFVSDKALLKNECPFSICIVNFDATVWSPRIGMKLIGKINLCSPDHISLLVHRTFNVSIPREHIPTDTWAFEYGPAENDPEFDPFAAEGEGNEPVEVEATDVDGDGTAATGNNAGESEEPTGIWVHKVTGDRLGGAEGLLEFTVISLTVANQMLSLKGSIQPDPFSPAHVPQPAIVTNARPDTEPEDDDEREEVEEELSLLYPNEVVDESEEEEDPFSHLARAQEEAVNRDAAEKKREEEEKAREKEGEKRRKKERKERKEKEKAEKGVVNGFTGSFASGSEQKPSKKDRKRDSQVS